MRRNIFLFAILVCTCMKCTKPDDSIKTPVPVAPNNLTGKAVSSSAVSLSWSDNSTNETGFKIERKTGTETYNAINTTDINIEVYNDTGLISNTTYKYRVYAFNAGGGSTTYSNEVSVTTDSLKHAPTVMTIPVSSITLNAAISGGNVNSDGGSAIISRGVVWSTSQNPTISLSTKTSDTTTSSTFTSRINGLVNNTTYYVKAYATNNIGTGYGEELSFKTSNVALATFSDSLIRVNAITEKSSTIYVPSLISDGSSSITEKGVVWSTSVNPVISLSTKTSNGSGTLRFFGDITGLTANTTYYVRAYATNSAGTSYSNGVNFKTLNYASPSVSDSISMTDITNNSGRAWIGPLKSDGGTAIISRGVVWSTTQDLTISLSTKTSSTTNGWLNFNITGLTSNQTYYIREYATNSVGTSYGKVISFVPTSFNLPTISDSSVWYISPKFNSAKVYVHSLDSDGGTPIISRGVVWSTSPSPTINLATKISIGATAGDFTTDITGLISKVTYYIREYASNSVGTVYGHQLTFVTASDLQNVAIGEMFEGGIVFYILKPGDKGYDPNIKHGLIAADQLYEMFGYYWGDNLTTSASDTSIGSGKKNTNLIISILGNSNKYAALVAAQKMNGYNDWYLPSKNELNQMYWNIGNGASGTNKNKGHFSNLTYWSSSEVNNLYAYYQYFGDGTEGYKTSKGNTYNVRPIRSF